MTIFHVNSELELSELLLAGKRQHLGRTLVISNSLQGFDSVWLDGAVVNVGSTNHKLLDQDSVGTLVLIIVGGEWHLSENADQVIISQSLTVQVHVGHTGDSAHGTLSSNDSVLRESVIDLEELLALLGSLSSALETSVWQVVANHSEAVANSLHDMVLNLILVVV